MNREGPKRIRRGPVAAGDERAIAALRAGGRISAADDALVANLRAAGRAIDANRYAEPIELASLLRVHLAAAVALARVVPSGANDDELDAWLRGILAPPEMGNVAKS